MRLLRHRSSLPARAACLAAAGCPFARAGVLIFAAGLLISVAAAAQPRGDARLWGEERYEAWGPFGEVQNWDGARVHAEGRFFPVNAGTWDFWMDTAETGQELRIQAGGIPSAAGRVSLQLGDYVVEEPRKDALRLEFQQPLWVRGASVTLKRPAYSIGIHAGSLTERKAVFGWGRVPIYEQAYGAALFGNWNRHGLWKADWTRQEGAPGWGEGLHQWSLFGGYTPPEGWSWLGQLRASREDASGAWGGSSIVGAGYDRARFHAAGHVRRLSPGFRNLGLYPDGRGNEWGARLEASYRPRPQVLVGTNWDWGRDLMTRPGLAVPEERIIARFFAATNLAGPFVLRGDVGYRNRSTSDPESLLVDQGTLSWEGALGWNTSRAQAEVAYTRSLYRDPLAVAGDWHEDRLGIHGQRRLGDRWRAELRGWLVNRRFLDGEWASREKKLEARGTWEPPSKQRAWLSVARELQSASDAAYDRDQWEIGAGWEQPLPWDLALELESLFFVRAGSFDTDRTRVSFRITRAFAFGGGGPGYRERLPEFGTISGRVFEDLNGDGTHQDGEPALAGQVLTFSNGRTVTTAADGRYAYSEAATYYESVTLDVGRLPSRYLAPDEPGTVYSLRPGEEQVRDFPIRPAAGLVGRVMIDLGHRAVGVPDVLLRVQGTHHDVFTDTQGRFYIPGLTPGPVTLEIIEWSLPKDAVPRDPLVRTVRLRAGRPVSAGIFVLQPVGDRVIQRFRAGGE